MLPPARARLRRGTLSREVILDAAVRTLGRPGAARVTMRSLADELGADPTAVYRHFRGKDDLLGALTDRLLEPLADPPALADWREQLMALGSGLHAILEERPGAIAVLAAGPFTPASLRALDRTVAALLDHGLPPELAVASCRAVVTLVIGHAAAGAGDPDGFWSGMREPGVPAGDLPALEATAAAWALAPAEALGDALELLLDGVDARRGAASARAGGDPAEPERQLRPRGTS